MPTTEECLLQIAHTIGMSPRMRREMMDGQAELRELLDGAWIDED